MARGIITPEIENNGLGMTFSLGEVRLIPYIMHCIHNSFSLDSKKLNNAEKAFLYRWQEEGLFWMSSTFIHESISFKVSEPFYDFMTVVMKTSYASDSIIPTDYVNSPEYISNKFISTNKKA